MGTQYEKGLNCFNSQLQRLILLFQLLDLNLEKLCRASFIEWRQLLLLLQRRVQFSAGELPLLPLLDGLQQVPVLQLGGVRVEVEVPFLGLREELLQQEDVGVS